MTIGKYAHQMGKISVPVPVQLTTRTNPIVYVSCFDVERRSEMGWRQGRTIAERPRCPERKMRYGKGSVSDKKAATFFVH